MNFPALANGNKPIRAVQLDLARQMETPEFICSYIDKVAAFGINTVQMYLEGRLRTTVFSLPDGECYTQEDMKKIVEHAEAKGILLIPVVSLLGHAEHFFKYPGHDEFSEEHFGIRRWGGTGKNTFCLSNPDTRAFLDAYVKEVCEIFPGPYFHVGFDESWNMGFCPRCAPKAAINRGDNLFAEFVNWAHDLCAKYGKRMWMWDDFFGFHPTALNQIPHDIVMCQWNYDPRISERGPRFNFGGHERTDWLELYARMGFDAVTVSWYKTENIRTLANYDRKSKSLGFIVSQWEDLADSFHGGSLPRVLARVLMADEPEKYQITDAFKEAVKRIFPSLNESEVIAATALLHLDPPRCLPTTIDAASAGHPGIAEAESIRLAVAVLKASALKPGDGEIDADPLCERSLLDDIVLRGETGLVDNSLRLAAKLIQSPRRSAADIKAAQAELAAMRPDIERVIERRKREQALWRPGCASCQNGGVPDKLVKALECIDRILALPAEPATPAEKRIEFGLTLTDEYGRPHWNVSGLFADGWKDIASGFWKPAASDAATFSVYVTFTSDDFPSQLKIDYNGCGAASMRYVQIENCDEVYGPKGIVAQSGLVRDAANLLVDDFSDTRFGYPNALDAIVDAAKDKMISSVIIELMKK